NMGDRHTWRIRKFVRLCLEQIDGLTNEVEQDFLRCVLLRTSQWALDCKKQTPNLETFRDQLLRYGMEAVKGATELRRKAVENEKMQGKTLCLMRSAIGCDEDERVKRFDAPALVITSPPYPGVHVLYHRWQINGRRETAAPYWIANLADG